MWLSDCGLVHKVSRITAPNLPLKAYEDLKVFKLFLVDVVLLGALAGLKQNILLDRNDLFVKFKGAFTEQYVFQQLVTNADIGVSLKTYREKYSPVVAIRTSIADYKENDGLVDVLLYVI